MTDSDTNNTDSSNSIFECGLFSQAITWAKEHGSDFLQFCIAEGALCVRLYNQERAQKEAPGWSLLEEATYQPLNPPVEAMELVLRARERFPQARLRQIHRDHHDEYVAVADAPWPDGYRLVFDDRIRIYKD